MTEISKLIKNLTLETAIEISKKYKIPLHPNFIFYWSELKISDFELLLLEIKNNSEIINEELTIKNLNSKRQLELIGLEHKIQNNSIIINKENTKILFTNITKEISKLLQEIQNNPSKSTLEIINKINEIEIRDKSGTYIGCRMGRPEKAKPRREFLEETSTNGLYIADNKDKTLNEELEKSEFQKYKKLITSPLVIRGVKKLTSKNKQNEHIIKSVLRAKHNLFVNKDGTCRYDATEATLTHFKPIEIGTSIEKLIELGYTHDYLGKKLKKETQILEIFPQDVILPNCDKSTDEKSSDFIINTSKFIDELLKELYNKNPIHNFKTKENTIGELIVSLAPHTSAGIIGRIIGYSNTQCIISSPLFHAAQRRNLDGDECGIILLSDCLINFSKEFLPDRRGARTMDCPLVLTTNINLDEVDDEVFGVDIVEKYPLELYKKSKEFKKPNEITIKQIKSKLKESENNKKYSNYNFTHSIENINNSNMISSYKTLPTMTEKLDKQLELQKKIRAVNQDKSAELIITRHFLRDIKGNLRSFSNQTFRCTNCNYILRRPTLNGKCPKCFKQSVNLTIHEASIKKYLDDCFKIINEYKISPYVIETIENLNLRLEEVFGK